MRKFIIATLICLSGTTAFSNDLYSVACNCAGFRDFLGYTYLVKGVIVGGGGITVGDALKQAGRQCMLGLYPGTCKAFHNGQLIITEF